MITFDLRYCSKELLKKMAEESRNAEDLRQLLEHDFSLTACIVAKNKYANKDILSRIYNEHKCNNDICYSLALNPSTPKSIMHQLALECDYTIGRLLLENDSIATEDIAKIVERHGKEYRIAVLAIDNPNTSASTLIKLAGIHRDLIASILDTGKVKLVES